eukprot:TRINITY_DN3873_c0_g1_i1.p1 TRINITY_DN3873_c0_g1~~TRINITY_DN3873_c0_g1_i1.p1  ORF type:complete len:1331 (+),score=212.74 TRINITY_DN3873_c0_g1_i1:800-4792(+)
MEKEVEKTRGTRERTGRSPRPSSVGTGTLEKKNKDLNKATKELEAKVKNLQQKTRSLPRVQSNTKARELPNPPNGHEEKSTEKRKGSTVTSRVREREAEFQKQVHERDEQITRLKERLKILAVRLAETKDKELKLPKEREKHAQATVEDGTELQNIIRQVTKERLQLERHLQIANDSLQRNNGVDLHKYLNLESTNHHLRSQLDSLDILQREYKVVEIQHREKEEACKELLNTLKYKSSLVEDLECQLAKVIEKNTELTIQNSDLQKKVVELHQVSDECAQLKNTLNEVESECVNAKSEVKNLSGKVRNLECVLEEMHKAAENRREIERQHKEALENLKKKQGEVEIVATKKQAEIIEQMKLKITDLEIERKVQNEKHQELILEMAELKRYGRDSLPEEIENPSDNIEIDQIMAKLEQDNKFLADLEKQRAANKGDSPPHRAGSAITDSGFLSQSSLNGNSMSPITREKTSYLHRSALELPGLSGADKINLLNGSFSASALNNLPGSTNFGSREVIVDKDGMVEIPGKGWCWVYLARYSYDPFQHSPNDTPEAELAINAGDYILVWSDPDEDGFFDGEILDGRKGLVPSNFVERLEGDHLVEFYKSVFLGIGDGDDSVCTSIPQDLDFISSDEGIEECQKYFTSRKATLSHYASCTDLDMTEDEGDAQSTSDYVAPPKHLTLETQLNKSFVIGWSLPDCPPSYIDHYQVMVDGEAKNTVGSTEKTLKAIAHGYDFGQIHRISVKAMGTNMKSSNEAACTMVVGKDAPLGPTNLRATRIRTTSATIIWLPSNTNFLHTLCLNNVEVRTVKQGVFKHTIAGLTPNTLYKVTVRAKNIKAAPYILDRNVSKQIDTLSSHIEIRTLPQGLPDPPVDVQVEVGPDPDTIMVMWLPVTITTFGLSNGAPVTGYVVYGDGKQIQDVDDPTADSAVVSIANLSIKAVTVRTKSNDKLSSESSSCALPDSLVTCETRMSGGNDDSDSENELIEKLQNHPVIAGPARTRELIINYSGYPDIDSDIGPSELSDIAEEPEDELTDSEDNRLFTPKILNPPKYDHTNMFKTPVDNSLNLLQDKKPDTTSSQIINSQFETEKFSNTISTNNKNQKPEQKNSNLNGSSEYNANSVTNNRSERMRIFVALFDYDPPSMSPNPDACEEELPFREGQLIKVFGEKDADGFYWGEAGTRSGFVPCNMVSEVQVDDERVAEELFREQAGSSASQKTDRGGSVDRDDRWGDIYEDMPMKRKIALYDYDPTELSPNVDSEVELSFKTGEIITIYGDMDDDGFYMGELNSRRGLVPSNFLTDIPSGYDPKNGFRQTQPRVLGQQRVPPAGGRW